MKKWFGVLVLVLLAVGCAAPGLIRPNIYVVVNEKVINKSFDVVWQNTVEWFATHNTPIKNLDKSSGLISTEYSLSLADARQYMDCGQGESNFSGKVELANPTGNFNVLVKRMDDDSTKLSINVFFSCTVNEYRYEDWLSTEYVLVSSTKTNCVSTGQLEKTILDYLSYR